MINEIGYAASGAAGEGTQHEYIELFNPYSVAALPFQRSGVPARCAPGKNRTDLCVRVPFQERSSRPDPVRIRESRKAAFPSAAAR